MRPLSFAWLWIALCLCAGCSGEDPPPAPPCDQECLDGTALRALRETVKLVYNLALQGNDVGEQDETTDCPLGGQARVFGEATSDAEQGFTYVSLTYELMQCRYLELDEEPPENYDMTLDGTLLQRGTIAVQPSATTALIMTSDGMSFSGTVYDPPREYLESACVLELAQSGSALSGTICGRLAGQDL